MNISGSPISMTFRGASGSIAGGEAPTLAGSFTIRTLYGIIHHPDGHTGVFDLGTPPATWEPAVLLDSTGEWFAVLERQASESSEYVILGDYFAHQRIFYAAGPNGLCVSTDHDTLARLLYSDAGELDLDWSYFLPTLGAQNVFAAGAWARNTIHRGIRELFPGEGLWIQGNQTVRFKKPFKQAHEPLSYEAHLAAGVSRATRQLEALHDSDIDEIRINLSGGRDSRVVLAMALAAGLRDKLTISSSDPTSFTGKSKETVTRDLHIAQAIGERYGIRNSVDRSHEPSVSTFSELLEIFQLNNSGGSYNLPASMASNRPVDPRIELHGGGGELLRAAFLAWSEAAWWERLIGNTRRTLTSDKHALFGVVMRSHLLTKTRRESSIAVFERALSEGNPSSLSEALNNHYHTHRNRWHFGQRVPALANRRLLHFPLEQPDLYQAANLVDFDLRITGIVAYDIIMQLEPELAGYPFDNAPGWPSKLTTARGGTTKMASEPSEPSQGRLQQALTQLRQNAAVRAVGVPKQPIRASDLAPARALLYLDKLNAIDPLRFSTASRDQIAKMLRVGQLSPLQTVTRLHSALAPLIPVDTPVHHISWDLRTTAQEILETITITKTTDPADWESNDVAMTVEATSQNGQVRVRAQISPQRPNDVWEVAVYLMLGESRIATRWYDRSLQADLEVPQEAKQSSELRVLVFARREGAPHSLPLMSEVTVGE